jgi:hypothetical protein
MRRRTVTMMQELPHFLRGCTLEELYQLAVALRNDLARRGRLSMLEADALVAVLLDEARVEHREIFSADCSALTPGTHAWRVHEHAVRSADCCEHPCRPTLHTDACPVGGPFGTDAPR